MAYDYDKTHAGIMKSATRRFMEAGFAGASVRQICKDAGVTNGAFYAHFDSKEELFGELVGPALEGLDELRGNETSHYMVVQSPEDVLESLNLAFSTDEAVIRYVYGHKDAFLLLLKASGGTSFENYLGRIVEEEKRGTIAFFELCKLFVAKPENMSESIAAQASSFVVSTIFDCLLSEKTEEEAIREVQLASEFCIAGLRQIWGLSGRVRVWCRPGPFLYGTS